MMSHRCGGRKCAPWAMVNASSYVCSFCAICCEDETYLGIFRRILAKMRANLEMATSTSSSLAGVRRRTSFECLETRMIRTMLHLQAIMECFTKGTAWPNLLTPPCSSPSTGKCDVWTRILDLEFGATWSDGCNGFYNGRFVPSQIRMVARFLRLRSSGCTAVQGSGSELPLTCEYCSYDNVMPQVDALRLVWQLAIKMMRKRVDHLWALMIFFCIETPHGGSSSFALTPQRTQRLCMRR